jgi:hypothetical protein
MDRKSLQRIAFLLFGIINLGVIGQVREQDLSLPFDIRPDLFDYSKPHSLGLAPVPGAETVTIVRPGYNTDKYSNGVVLIPFGRYLYAQWQSSALDEDAADTRVVFSRSSDGQVWTEPVTLSPHRDNGIFTSGGWWTYRGLLIAYINFWPEEMAPKGGYTKFMTSPDGISWSDPEPLLNKEGGPLMGIFEQDPHALPNGRIINAVHEQPGLIVAPYFTDDPAGLTGWTRGIMVNLAHNGTMSREIEPGWFRAADGDVVMIFRDEGGSFRTLAAVSHDKGNSWTTPVLTEMPDSRSKQCAGNLPDGTAFIVNNPGNNKDRFPLAITLSRDGKLFDRAYLLRAGGKDLQPLLYAGRYKRPGYHYPKAVIWNDFLYVSYATNKEDVEFTRIPVAALAY